MRETQETPQKIDQAAYLEIGEEGKPNFKEFYPVHEPFGYVGISIERETGKLLYLSAREHRRCLNELG
jgi:hypothetical protein